MSSLWEIPSVSLRYYIMVSLYRQRSDRYYILSLCRIWQKKKIPESSRSFIATPARVLKYYSVQKWMTSILAVVAQSCKHRIISIVFLVTTLSLTRINIAILSEVKGTSKMRTKLWVGISFIAFSGYR